ncbi:MAG TPA: glycosyltransferase family 4 protein, partial [Chthoniobacteraceae bacterium]|nr:glycosyltransferase family 4 protein [Chthoniobacteraceae bacterium]
SALQLLPAPPPLVLVGRNLEGADFWRGLPREAPGEDPLAGARVVVLPAWVEHQPRRLLEALARGIPVIATRACGLGGLPGVTEIPEGDVTALAEALQRVCFGGDQTRCAAIAADVNP